MRVTSKFDDTRAEVSLPAFWSVTYFRVTKKVESRIRHNIAQNIFSLYKRSGEKWIYLLKLVNRQSLMF